MLPNHEVVPGRGEWTPTPTCVGCYVLFEEKPMKDQIEDYEPKSPAIVAVGDRRVRAFVGDQPARLGHVLWVGDEPTRIVTLAGARRVEAIAFDTSSFAVDDAVRVGERVAGWPAPVKGATPLERLRFVPGRDVDLSPTNHAPTSLPIGSALDDVLPIAHRGVTLVLDTGAADDVFDRLYDRVADASGDHFVAVAPRALSARHQVVGMGGLALTVAARWAAELGDPFVIEAEPFDLDELLDPLRGTTVIVRLILRDGLEILGESLDLGHSDTQLLVRPDGTLDLTRSSSRLLTTDRFAKLADVRGQLAIFGEHELDAEALQFLEDASRLERDWLL